MTKKIDLETLLTEEIRPVGQGSSMRAPLEEMSTDDLVVTYMTLNALSSKIEARLKAIKPIFHDVGEREGVRVGDGDQLIPSEVGGILRKLRVSTAPNDEKIRALLYTRGIPVTDVFDEEKTLVLNPSKLQFLVDTGKLGKNEIEPLHDRDYAIISKPDADIKERLAETFREPKAKKTKARK